MTVYLKIYNLLVNRIPGIRERYQNNRNKNLGSKKIISWLYLLWLNLEFYILRKKSVGESILLNPDKGKKILSESESESINVLSQEALEEKLLDYDIISFDIFDTLIFRKLARPEDVFFLIQEKLEYPNFKALRKSAEEKSRAKRYEQAGDYEVTLKDIWIELALVTGINPEIGIQCELCAENEVCYANPYFLEVIAYLKEHHKKLIVCSDMYLGKDIIKELMLKCGYPEFDEYYISCDYHQSKYNGELYKIIKEDLGNQWRYIHVGDNEFSDIKQGEKGGFDTYYYPNVQATGEVYRAKDMDPIISSVYSGIVNSYLHNGANKESPEFEFGFVYGGLFVTGYCQFIHEYVILHNIEKILFFARDGEILNKVYKQLYPEEKDLCEYAYWSRLAATKLVAPILKSHFVERMVLHKIDQNYKLKDIFGTMGITDMLEDFCITYPKKGYSENTYFNFSTSIDLQLYLNDHWNEVIGHYENEQKEAKTYYQNLVGNAKRVVAVDVGWVGSGAISLSLITKKLWGFDCNITGIIAGTCSANNQDYEATAIELAKGNLVSYMFSASINRDIWKMHDAYKGHNMLVELLLSSEQMSFRGFTKDEKGNYEFNASSEKIDAAQIQQGILKFSKLYKEHPFGHLMISGRDAAAPITLLYENQSYVNRLLGSSEIRANIE